MRIAVFILLGLIMLAPWMNYSPAPFTGDGNPFRQLFYLADFGLVVAAGGIARYPARFMVVPLSVVVILIWCWLSLSWAIDADIGSRRLGLTTLIVLTVFIAVEQLGVEGTLGVARVIMVLTLAGNYVAVIGFPSFGIHDQADLTDPNIIGSWRGFLLQKNYAGAVCAYTILFYLFSARSVPPMRRILVIVFSIAFLIGTRSKTSMGLLALSIVFGYLFMKYNPKYSSIATLILVLTAITATILIYIYWDALLAPFDDDTSFTGRVQIWPPLIEYWHDHILFGAGYGSFWNIGPDSPIFAYTRTKSWVRDLGNGHNGYIDLLVQIGLPGTILAIMAVIVWPILRLLSARTMQRQHGALILACVLFSALHNLTESSLLDRDDIVEVFFMLTLALMGPAMRDNAMTGAVQQRHAHA